MYSLKMSLFQILFFSAVIAVSSFLQPNPVEVAEQKRKEESKAKEALLYCRKHHLDTNLCMLVDMSLHSGKNRFFIWDFQQKKEINSGLVCHGLGKESTCSTPVFSNEKGSNCTSLGKYKVGKRGYSNWGTHVNYEMIGLERTNSNAQARLVVLHSYEYVPNFEIYPSHLPLGWSKGCPVVSENLMTAVDTLLKKKDKQVLLWIYK